MVEDMREKPKKIVTKCNGISGRRVEESTEEQGRFLAQIDQATGEPLWRKKALEALRTNLQRKHQLPQ